MSGKQFLVLLCLFVLYLILGAVMFHLLELPREIEQKREDRRSELEIYSILLKNLENDTMSTLVPKLESYCGKTFNIDVDVNKGDPYKWHFYNAVFFVITVVSTIGYGNLAPTFAVSRILMIFYALVGIPMNGILLKSLADYFAHFFLRARDKYKTHHHNAMSLAVSTLLYVSLGFGVFILSPSVLFMYFENWTFDEAIYYAFVSLTTIGFGDLVAGQDPRSDTLYTLYHVFLIVWLLFGLGYLFMVLGFITDAMRSKRMAKLSQGIKHTQTKLWNGVVHEMPHLLRRVLNELYLLKVKPVYHGDDCSVLTLQMGDRCSSCPNLFWVDDNKPFPVVTGMPGLPGMRRTSRATAGFRPRALSEVLPSRLLVRRRSETELARIDRRATFGDTAAPTDSALDPAELLHEFMNALVNWGGAVNNEEAYNTMHKAPGTALPTGGYQGFPDADILSSEWSQQHVLNQRQRAKSLAPFTAATDALAAAHYGYGGVYGGHLGGGPRPLGEEDWDDSSTLPADEAGLETGQGQDNNAEWTWSGNAASKRVHELIRTRQNRRRSEAFIRKQQKQDRRMQELQDFQRLKALDELRQIAKEAEQKKKRLRSLTTSLGTADTGATAPSTSGPRTSVSGLMQRLAIPQRLKDLARRRRSLQPEGYDLDDDLDRTSEKRRSPSYDPVSPPWPALAALDPYRTLSAGDSLLGVDTGQGRRDSIFRRNSATVHPVLENTSLAEFLRVLQSVQRQTEATVVGPPGGFGAQQAAPPTPGKTRKLGTAGLQPDQPSIFNVFPGLLDNAKPEKRRSSLRPSSPPLTAGVPGNSRNSSRRRMSFWPSFGTDQTANGGVSGPPAPATSTSGVQRRKNSKARRLSNFFGGGFGGTCTDPAPDDKSEDEQPANSRFKVTKRRRYSMWPTLGVLGRGSGDSSDGKPPLDSPGDMEGGRSEAQVAASVVPQISITYANDVPPAPAPREALRRLALTSGMGSPPMQDSSLNTPARLRYPRTSLGGGPIPLAHPIRPYPSPLSGRRGPSVPSPLSTPVASFRRRALSESTRTRPSRTVETEDDDSGEDAQILSERL